PALPSVRPLLAPGLGAVPRGLAAGAADRGDARAGDHRVQHCRLPDGPVRRRSGRRPRHRASARRAHLHGPARPVAGGDGALRPGWKGVGIWTGLATGLAIVALLMIARWLRRGQLGLLDW